MLLAVMLMPTLRHAGSTKGVSLKLSDSAYKYQTACAVCGSLPARTHPPARDRRQWRQRRRRSGSGRGGFRLSSPSPLVQLGLLQQARGSSWSGQLMRNAAFESGAQSRAAPCLIPLPRLSPYHRAARQPRSGALGSRPLARVQPGPPNEPAPRRQGPRGAAPHQEG